VPSIRPTSLLVGLASAAVAIAPAAVAVGSPAAAITVASTSTLGAVDGAQSKQRDGSPGTLVLIAGRWTRTPRSCGAS
jgi:hypothetical protein